MKGNLIISTTNPSTEAFARSSGPVPFQMTNDYLFRAVFQSNPKALKGLICSLLHLTPEEVKSTVINNPIEIGKSIYSKEFILDISLTLNNYSVINLEMQIGNKHNWPERSLSYMCRTFDDLNKGDDYLLAKPVIHIGFLDFELFPDHPEFYATYKFLNVKNYNIFSDKLTLSVVNLNRTDLATTEDKAFGIDHWAKLFKSTTWEEIKMLATKNPGILEAANSMYDFTSDKVIREHCRMHEEYLSRTRGLERLVDITEERACKAEERADKAEAELARLRKQLELINS